MADQKVFFILAMELINLHRFTKYKLKLIRRDMKKKGRSTTTSKQRIQRKMKRMKMMTKPPECIEKKKEHKMYNKIVSQFL